MRNKFYTKCILKETNTRGHFCFKQLTTIEMIRTSTFLPFRAELPKAWLGLTRVKCHDNL